MAQNYRVLYLGDDSLQGAASYLGGVLTHAGISFLYCPNIEKVSPEIIKSMKGLLILSDYPASNMSSESVKALVESVHSGSSLLMIGGWESFHGLKGGYSRGPVADLLPVECLNRDDRINWCQGVVPWVLRKHPCLEKLPWDQPPIFCGFNETRLKPGAECVLSARPLKIQNNRPSFSGEEYPLLVFGKSGGGKTCALTTDLAPHWVGGWVDWGKTRIKAQSRGGGEVEVGTWYAQFITQLVTFLFQG